MWWKKKQRNNNFFLLSFLGVFLGIGTNLQAACGAHDYHKCAHGIDTTSTSDPLKCPNGICAEISWPEAADIDFHLQVPAGEGPYVGSDIDPAGGIGLDKNAPFIDDPSRHVGWEQRTVTFNNGQSVGSLSKDNRDGSPDTPEGKRFEAIGVINPVTGEYNFAGHNYNNPASPASSANYTVNIATDGKGFVTSHNHLPYYQEKGFLAKEGDSTATYTVNYVNNGHDPHAIGSSAKGLETVSISGKQTQDQHKNLNARKQPLLSSYYFGNDVQALAKNLDKFVDPTKGEGIHWNFLRSNDEFMLHDYQTRRAAYEIHAQKEIDAAKKRIADEQEQQRKAQLAAVRASQQAQQKEDLQVQFRERIKTNAQKAGEYLADEFLEARADYIAQQKREKVLNQKDLHPEKNIYIDPRNPQLAELTKQGNKHLADAYISASLKESNEKRKIEKNKPKQFRFKDGTIIHETNNPDEISHQNELIVQKLLDGGEFGQTISRRDLSTGGWNEELHVSQDIHKDPRWNYLKSVIGKDRAKEIYDATKFEVDKHGAIGSGKALGKDTLEFVNFGVTALQFLESDHNDPHAYEEVERQAALRQKALDDTELLNPTNQQQQNAGETAEKAALAAAVGKIIKDTPEALGKLKNKITKKDSPSGNSVDNGSGSSGKVSEDESSVTSDIAPAKRISNQAVLGSYPDYVKLSDKLAARRFEIPQEVWNKMTPMQQWTANKKFLDRMISKGDDIILSNSAYKAQPGTWFAREIGYLKSQGYRISDDGLRMLPGN